MAEDDENHDRHFVCDICDDQGTITELKGYDCFLCGIRSCWTCLQQWMRGGQIRCPGLCPQVIPRDHIAEHMGSTTPASDSSDVSTDAGEESVPSGWSFLDRYDKALLKMALKGMRDVRFCPRCDVASFRSTPLHVDRGLTGPWTLVVEGKHMPVLSTKTKAPVPLPPSAPLPPIKYRPHELFAALRWHHDSTSIHPIPSPEACTRIVMAWREHQPPDKEVLAVLDEMQNGGCAEGREAREAVIASLEGGGGEEDNAEGPKDSDGGRIPCPYVVCPACDHEFCFMCTSSWHPGVTCEVHEREKRTDLASAYDTGETRRCPTCAAKVEKNGGCDHMLCTECWTDWCWACGRLDSECAC
ncbi:unnamed protein product [Vitrella brassicaformis CCMP3155]|uniref:RBR-type E3 ubiquitin transferase n=2 Tax=Vitrella brassicaformis TaxID=1169539 RepID=A0A0G4EJ93_VITBC|nr:unnamed protein product [Vitrella brassicaformis CCMP3155]|eukprot:CEL96784.1 unnamed protein product [Vitrella brassicaformis CCMP3155]